VKTKGWPVVVEVDGILSQHLKANSGDDDHLKLGSTIVGDEDGIAKNHRRKPKLEET